MSETSIAAGSLAARRLGMPAAVLAVALAAVGVAHYTFGDMQENLERTIRMSRQQALDFQAETARLEAEAKAIAEGLDTYTAIVGTGFREPQDRLAMVRTIEEVAAASNVPKFEYTLHPESVVADATAGKPGHVVVSTRVDVRAWTTYDSDLVGFVEMLLQNVPGQVKTTKLELKRSASPGDIKVDTGEPPLMVGLVLEFEWRNLRSEGQGGTAP